MTSARDRANIAKAKLALLGEPKVGESSERTKARADYQQMLDDAMHEIAAADRERLPYKDGDDQ